MIKKGGIGILIVLLCIGSCKQTDPKEEIEQINKETVLPTSNVPRVTGIGGIFFMAEQPDSTSAWYRDNLGLALDEYGSVFEFRNARNPGEKNYLRWSVSSPTSYFEPSDKGFMINYRVQHMEALLDILRKNGVTILDSIVEYPYGKFVHILDPENNKVELWEPVDSVLTALGGATTK